MLTRREAELVNETIPALRQHGEHISTVFYKSMLRDHPELNHYFNSVNMHTGRQPRALTALILAFASNIVNISELTEKLERVAQKHASLVIRPEHYEIVAKYLIRAFSAVLGPAMTPEVNAAWTKAYWLMAKSKLLSPSYVPRPLLHSYQCVCRSLAVYNTTSLTELSLTPRSAHWP